MAFQTIACRMELLLNQSKRKLARVAPDKVQALKRISDTIDRHRDGFKRSLKELRACRAQIHDSIRFTTYFSMATLDQITMFILILHTFLLTLNDAVSESAIYWIMNGFAVYYTVEMTARLKAAQSLSRFITDPRGGNHSFRNLTALMLWIVGACLIVLGIAAQTDAHRQFCHVAASAVPCGLHGGIVCCHVQYTCVAV